MLSIDISRFTCTERCESLSVDRIIIRIEFSVNLPRILIEVTYKRHGEFFFDRLVLIGIDAELNALSNETTYKLR
jgi:DNA-binding Lrp family transcriptional regulator